MNSKMNGQIYGRNDMVMLPNNKLYGSLGKTQEELTIVKEGSEIVCEKSLKAPFLGLNIYGKSTQATTTGTNLFDISKLADISAWDNEKAGVFKIDEKTIKVITTADDSTAYARDADGVSITFGTLFPEISAGDAIILTNGSGKTNAMYINGSVVNYGEPYVVKDGDLECGARFYASSSNAEENITEIMCVKGEQLLELTDGEIDAETAAVLGITVSVKNNVITINGTAQYDIPFGAINYIVEIYPGTYILSTNADNIKVKIGETPAGTAFEVTGVVTKAITVAIEAGTIFNNEKVYLALNEVATALPWEPYTGGKPSPNPDYPQEIVSAGDKGNIEVNVTGKNLFDPKLAVFSPVYWKYDNGKWSTTDSQGTYVYIEKYLRKDQIYTLSADCENIMNGNGRLEVREGTKTLSRILFSNAGRKSLTFSVENDGEYRILFGGIEHESIVFSTPQLEVAKVPTAYEPYKEPQTLTLQTPNGLPGIPVNSGGNYIDANGQQWICDEIDFERGVYVQRVAKRKVTDADRLSAGTNSVGNEILIVTYNDKIYEKSGFLCNIGIDKKVLCLNPYEVYENPANIVLIGEPNDTLESLLQKFGKGVLLYVLASSIETDLTQEQIEQYKQIHTNTPTTIIKNDEDAWMKVAYKAFENI